MVRQDKPATIRDVAARAGVSTATVSRTLRHSANVGPETRARVEEAARVLRYRPSGVARSLKLRSTHTIGLIVTDIENPYFPQIVSAVEDAARLHGHSVLLADGRRDPERELESLDLLAEREVDGLIIASSALGGRFRERIVDLPCPVVIVNSDSTVPKVPAVVSDNEAGGRIAVEHLVSLGHEHLVYIAAPSRDNRAATDRLRGAEAGLESLGGVQPLGVVTADAGVVSGSDAATEAISRFPATTGILCYNDLTAIGAIRGLRALGLVVPTNVSVMGFDDIEFAPYVDPPLTTVRQPTADMARRAVESLFARIDATNTPEAAPPGGEGGETHRLPVELVVRDSTSTAP